jgi:hypothetical protein
MEYDIQFVVDIIENHLTPESFEYCRYIQDQIRWCKQQEVLHSSFDSLSQRFTNPLYEMFLKIDWDRVKDKESYDFDNHEEYQKLKENEVRSSFIFTNSEEIQKFYSDFVYLKNAAKNEWSYNESLELIIDENCTKNFKLGCELLKVIIKNNNEINYIPRMAFYHNLNSIEKAQRIWAILSKNNFNAQIQWKLSFFDYIDNTLIDEKCVNLLQNTIENIKEPTHIYFNNWKKYLSISPNLFETILETIVEKNEKEDNFIFINDFSFEGDFEFFKINLDLIKKAYLQQNIKQGGSHFDYIKKILIKILQQDSSFLIDYINSLYIIRSNGHYLHENHYLSIVWKIVDVELILIQIFDLIIKKDFSLGISEHFCNSFFHNLQGNEKDRAKEFLLAYCRNNYGNLKKMNIVVDIVRNSMNDLFEEVLLLYVELTQDVELFRNIWWIGRGGTYSGDVIIGDIEAAKWRNVLSIVEKSSVGIKLIPIRQYINLRIGYALKDADWERKRKFIEER